MDWWNLNNLHFRFRNDYLIHTLEDEIRVVVIATGFEGAPNSAKPPVEEKKKASPLYSSAASSSPISSFERAAAATSPSGGEETGVDDDAFNVLMQIFDR